MRCNFAFPCSVLVLLAIASKVLAAPPNLKTNAELIQPTAGDSFQAATPSPDRLHIAYVAPDGSRSVAVIDGKSGPKYDRIIIPHGSTRGSLTSSEANPTFMFSPDGQRVAYVASRGKDSFLVIDALEFPVPMESQYEGLGKVIFSPDSKQYAFAINPREDYSKVILNGKEVVIAEEPHFKGVENLQFSSNSKHFAYIANNSKFRSRSGLPTRTAYAAVVIDGRQGQEFDEIQEFLFNSDGEHYGYIGIKYGPKGPTEPGKKYSLVKDGKEIASSDKIADFRLSPDGQHVMFTKGENYNGSSGYETYAENYICLDDKQWKYIPTGKVEPPQLSPDGQRVAYVEGVEGGSNNGAMVSVNGKSGASYSTIQNLCFSPDSQRVYYFAAQTGSGRSYVVCDDTEAGPYFATPNSGEFSAFNFTFSPDGKHMAYMAGDGKDVFVVSDRKNGKPFGALYGSVVFTPDSKHLAYFAVKKGAVIAPLDAVANKRLGNHDSGRYLVVDDKEKSIASQLGMPGAPFRVYISADNKHMAWIAKNPVVDLHPLPPSQGFQLDSQHVDFVTFTPDGNHFIYGVRILGMGKGDPNSRYLAVDGNVIQHYAALFGPGFLPDGKMQYFGVEEGTKALNRITVDLGSTKHSEVTGR